MSDRLAVVVPAHNEASRIGAVLSTLPSKLAGFGSPQVIVVDDGSSDETSGVARRHGATVVRHPVNLGKGGALRTGCEAALRRGCDVILVMDADGQHRASDIPKLLLPIQAGRADLVLGCRPFSGQMPATMRLGNWGLSGLFGFLFGRHFRDTQSGMRAMTAAAYRRLRWDATSYAVETEMLVRAARARLRVAEVEIETVYHDAYKGTTALDGMKILADMLRWRARRS